MFNVNDVIVQAQLLSRLFVYQTLRDFGVPVPDFYAVHEEDV